MITPDFFIAYSREDASAYAFALADLLTQSGFSCYTDKFGTSPSQDVPRDLETVIRKSLRFIFIVSKGATHSRHIEDLLEIARRFSKPTIIIDIGGIYLESRLLKSDGFSFTESSEALETGHVSPQIIETLRQALFFSKISPGWLFRLRALLFKLFSMRGNGPGIFISYRTNDSVGYALWLYEVLRIRFRWRIVFLDVAQIEGGSNFDHEIRCGLAKCKVLAALIGKEWLSATDSAGNLRLHDPGDYVYLEILTALNEKLRILPVLLDEAEMPKQQELPDSISGFAYLKPVPIRARYATDDLRNLLRAIRIGLKTSRRGGDSYHNEPET